MNLIDLEPQFIRRRGNIYKHVDRPRAADGIIFLCPVCFKRNKGSIGTHKIICYRPHVSLDILPGPGRWEFKGTGYHDLTLVAGSSSIWLKGPGCGAHFFIRDGKIC